MRYAIIALLTCVSFAQTLPDAPSASKKKVADNQFWVLTGIHAAAVFADAGTTAVFVSHSTACSIEVGTPWLYGRKAQDARVFAVMTAEAVAVPLVSYLLKKHEVHVWKLRLWRLPLAWSSVTHGNAAIHNLRTCL